MHFKNIFVTVGTTEFDDLTELISSSRMGDILKGLNCKNLTVQIGRGKEINFVHPKFHGINIVTYRLKPSINEDILESDLVISHAGAGSCIEVLHAGKPLLVVVNEKLMDNHQTELAEQLQEDGFLFCCTTKTFFNTLLDFNVRHLKPYVKGNPSQFIQHLDKLMGF